jgi:hypothetical protein
MDIASGWQRWLPPYDPRLGNGAMLTRDEHGRLIESADCGVRCPGCGICCAGYRDVITADYMGVEEYAGNLNSGHGGLVRQADGQWWYRAATCGAACPGYGGCCQPFDRHLYPRTIADARRILLEEAAAPRWAMQEALLILAHAGTAEAAETLATYLPVAHIRLAGFAACASDEGCYLAGVPRSAEEECRMMKQEARATWENRASEAQRKICEDLEPQLARQRYELAIARRLLSKAQDEAARTAWRTQMELLGTLVGMTESDLAEQHAEVARCEAMVAEIEADLAT